MFILTVLDQTLTYEVDQIRIVEPSDVSALAIEPEMDLCTLVTCTPYGVNTHRLLVRGHRVENDRKTDIRLTADAMRIQPMFVAPYLAIPVLVILVIWMMIVTSRGHVRRKRQREQERQQEIRETLFSPEEEDREGK